MAFSFYIHLLLRFLGNKWDLKWSALFSRPPELQGFLRHSLQSKINPIQLPSFLVPKTISSFNENNIISKPTPNDSAKLVLPEVGEYKFTFWRPGFNTDLFCILDSDFSASLNIRQNILDTYYNNVSRQLPESNEACREAFLMVVEFLVIKYPHVYKKKEINHE